MAITVNDAKGNPLYTINVDQSGKVTAVKKESADAPVDAAILYDALQGTKLDSTDVTWTLDKLLGSLGATVLEGKDPKKEGEIAIKRLTALNDAITGLKNQIAAEKGKTPPDSGKIATLENALKTADAQLKQLFGQVSDIESKLSPDAQNQLKSIANSPNLTEAQAAAQSAGKAQTAATSPQQSQAPQTGNAPQQGYPAHGKAQNLPQPPFDMNALMQSSLFQSANLNSLDQLGKTQMDQKKMMMLFMYFAMMAMSGDIGAMTAFMQFITTIILKDKSMQNVNMANKLIELEDASRKATDQLLNTASYDPNNPQVAADFSKVMERVKADQGSIATSQKLIAQMMEEFAQVSEFLNNLQKSLLDVRGRILSRVSTFNA